MKLNIIVLLVIFTIVFGLNIDPKKRLERKQRRADKDKCSSINFKLDPKKTEATSADDGKTQFPQYVQVEEGVLKNAKAQLVAARKCLYKPQGKALDILKVLASKTSDLISSLPQKDVFVTKFSGDGKEINIMTSSFFNRQVQSGGTLSSTVDNSKDTDPKQSYLTFIGKLNNIASGSGNGQLHAGLLALIGDIGTAMNDARTKTGAEGDVLKTVVAKLKIMIGGAVNLGPKELDDTTKTVIDALGGNALVPKKVEERGFCLYNGARVYEGRSGLSDLGAEADKTAKSGGDAIAPVGAPWQTVPNSLLKACPNEPFAGHVSGSIVEVLLAMDSLTWKRVADAANITNTLNPDAYINPKSGVNLATPERKAKAALAASMLIGLGFHSAVEVAPTIRKYLNQNPIVTPLQPTDYSKLCADNQSDYITKLIDDNCNK